jgi:tetratricopeptide (TPR) repeat protein
MNVMDSSMLRMGITPETQLANRDSILRSNYPGETRNNGSRRIVDVNLNEESDVSEPEDAENNVKTSEKQSRTGKKKEPENTGDSVLLPVDEKELTILFYMKADPDNIGETLAQQIVDMERVGSTDDINVVAQLSRKPNPRIDPKTLIDGGWTGNRRYYVTRNDEPDFKLITLEKLLDTAEKYPDNPIFLEDLCRVYRNLGDHEKVQEYWDKAHEINKDMDFDERDKKGKEYLSVVKREYGNLLDEYLIGYERVGVKEISSGVIEESPNLKPGERPADLQDFIEWGMENFPAENYVLVMCGHGFASEGCLDMTPAEISKALSEGVKNTNEKTGRDDSIDATVLNSCFMGNLEFVTEVQDNTDIVIGSQEICYRPINFQWDNIISGIQENIDKTGSFEVRKFAEDFVDHFRIPENDPMNNTPQDGPRRMRYNKGYTTLSAIDTSKVPDLLESFNNLLEICQSEGVSDSHLFKTAEATADFNPGPGIGLLEQNPAHLRDLGGFLKNMQEAEESPDSVKEAAADVLAKLEEAVIDKHNTQRKPEEASGLHFWVPPNTTAVDAYFMKYAKNVPEFFKATQWDEKLVKNYLKFPRELIEEAYEKTQLADIVNYFGIDNIPPDLPKEKLDGIKKNPNIVEEAKKLQEMTSFANIDEHREKDSDVE